MGIFSQKPKFKVAAPTIRKIVVPVEAKPKSKPQLKQRDSSSAPPTLPAGNRSDSLSVKQPNGSGSARSSKTLSVSPRLPASPNSASSRNRISQSPYPPGGDRKRKLVSAAPHRASPAASDRVEFGKDSDTEEDDDGWEAALHAREQRKRARLHGSRAVDLDRRLAHRVVLETLPRKDEEPREEHDGKERTEKRNERRLRIIHAASLASTALKCVPVLGATLDEVSVELQYPGSRHRERYELVWGKDKIDAVKDIKTIVRYISEVYLTDEEASPFLDPTAGIVRQLERASSDAVRDVKMFKGALNDFNSRLLELHNNGTIAANLAEKHDLPSHLVAFILDQVYDRTVAPKVELLRKYENGTDNVYGELLHPFITDILVDRLKMTSGQVFVDLGSGVGNVVLQAALEIGCESWGCEMMENACNLAEEQKKEFSERCRLWGIAPGAVHLERGDFRANSPVQDALKRADVVLVNNQAFTSQLNDDLVRMFLDFKSGCKIVSLKSFVHDHKSASHNINDVGSTILDVEELTYPEGYVSWTGVAGKFCISTRR